MRQVAVVGAGPAGFYLADRLMKKSPNIRINMLETSIFPFGLIRYGVAPDHPEIKLCSNSFSAIAADPRFSFYGGIGVGIDIQIDEIQRYVDAVAVCSGASKPRSLNIDGEHSSRCINSSQFISWINGLPNYGSQKIPDLSTVKSVAIIGNGNVALDVARIFLRRPEDFFGTDIASYALQGLISCNVEEVHIFGRRDVINASFTAKEFREILDLDIDIFHDPEYFCKVAGLIQQGNYSRRINRLISLMEMNAQREKKPSTGRKKCRFHYNHVPFKFEENRLRGKIAAIFKENNNQAMYEVDLVITCLGYEKEQELLDENKAHLDGQIYRCGWASTGASGALASTLANSHSVADAIIQYLDLNSHSFKARNVSSFSDYLSSRSLRYSTWNDWKQLSAVEIQEGIIRNKIREKINDGSLAKELIREFIPFRNI